MKILEDIQTLKALANKYHLEIDMEFKYYSGNAYMNLKDEILPRYFKIGNRTYKLKYFDGCFNPFFVEVV